MLRAPTIRGVGRFECRHTTSSTRLCGISFNQAGKPLYTVPGRASQPRQPLMRYSLISTLPHTSCSYVLDTTPTGLLRPIQFPSFPSPDSHRVSHCSLHPPIRRSIALFRAVYIYLTRSQRLHRSSPGVNGDSCKATDGPTTRYLPGPRKSSKAPSMTAPGAHRPRMGDIMTSHFTP